MLTVGTAAGLENLHVAIPLAIAMDMKPVASSGSESVA
jgi:hypothetical protein